MIKIIREVFKYLKSIPENRDVIQKLQQDLGYRIKQVWDYILQHPPEALSAQIQEDISNRRTLSVGTILMIYPTFHKICVEYNDANRHMKFASLEAVERCRDRKEISQEQYVTVSRQIELFFRQNKILFDLDGSSPRSYKEIV